MKNFTMASKLMDFPFFLGIAFPPGVRGVGGDPPRGLHHGPLLAIPAGCGRPASRAVIRSCAARVNAHIRARVLRFPRRRAPWLTARYWLFDSLLDICGQPKGLK